MVIRNEVTLEELITIRKTPLILIIEDEENIRISICNFLEDSGYDVIEAENGLVGMELFEKEKPDLILCDMWMPEMDGVEVVRRISSQYPDMPIVIVSGAAVVGDAIEVVRQGAWDYIIKPITDMDILVASVEKALDRARLILENKLYQNHLEQRTQELKREIEERKNAETKLIQVEKMAALGDLVAGVAHEINTPVGIGITGISHLQDILDDFNTNFLKGKIKKTDLKNLLIDSREACQMILTNLTRAAELVSSFKQVAVDQTNDEVREIQLEKYFKEILLSLGPKLKTTGHVVSLECASHLEIKTFPGALSQIITNLIMNSVIHAFDNVDAGNILVAIKIDPDNENNTLIEFSDDGKGMSPEDLEKLFDPFFTTKRGQGGTGLGMHLVYTLVVETLKGEINCKSEIGKGMFYSIVIPNTL